MAIGRQFARPIAWMLLLLFVCHLWTYDPLHDARTLGPDGVSILPDVPYGTGDSSARRLTILVPSAESRTQRPAGNIGAILAIHGGSWIGGSRYEYYPQLIRLAQHGLTVFVADYQLARPGMPSWPAALEDLRQAVRWIGRNGHRYQTHPGQLAILGSASGGLLALLLADEPDVRVKAVISLYGATDLEELVRERRLEQEPVKAFLGADAPSWLDRARLASPIHRATPSKIPILLIHGLSDQWVLPEQARRYDRVLARRGVMHRLLLLPDARHGFELQLGDPSRSDLLPNILDFLSSVSHD
ncbi:alpha/beta hydrolase fold protein [Aquisphaera giovannonii]|uniref:Alpha/beta hydrolase fold protein n=1 Tax=Aquisphaera giovannonii TaxID=406548 RepID=A0A5B9W079_9BACT|nr:alpha/beta hydrolase [Aquisphaera giovannonii]QEH33681.1 alpha/beta hydrolase fold protein [Aquisphaera giovannonii]